MLRETMHGQEDYEAAQQIAQTAEKGMLIVDCRGEVIWTDARLKQRLDGELKRLHFPLNRGDARATRPVIEGFNTTVDLEISGEMQQVCVVQQTVAEPTAAEADLQRIVDSVE